jgi:uncharacterized protein with PIN domain
VSRIRKAYQVRFRTLLQRARARRLEQGVELLVARACRLSASEQIPQTEAFTRVYDQLAARAHFRRPTSSSSSVIFWCDAGLGGLARWLRAAGYDARWRPDIADDELVREARKITATLLTTDSLLMERRLLRDGIVPGYWLPPTLGIPEQLALVFREFGLTQGEPRCMSCGGELRRVEKEALRDRIPPKTYRWIEEYFVCARCDHLFWRGTHWTRIQQQLRLVGATAGTAHRT